MTKDKREGWLKELKVGDVVGYLEHYSKESKGYGVINKITPTGKIDIAHYRFNSDGTYTSGNHWNRSNLELIAFTNELKQEIDNKILKQKIVDKLNNYNYTTLTLEQLKDILEIIEPINK